ncbi:MAG: methyltransferase domain-containing protein [Candidatus Marinimicrobia bacterium]|nr:methyltransferase domain-containing protein [Candidatus Neomarinimicrobiota bacterium]
MYIEQELNTKRVEAFEGELVDTLNKGASALMISIGHRTGLFDTLSDLEPSNSSEIAHAAGLNERYVREWLGAMSANGVVKIAGSNGDTKYYLPGEHAALLTRKHPEDNMALFAQYIGLLGQVENQIVEHFQLGGGVPYSAFDGFHRVLAEESSLTVVAALVEHILPLIPGIFEQLDRGIDVLDVGCGSGHALNLLAEKYPNSRFTGYDLNKEPLELAISEAVDKGLTNVRFIQKDLTDFYLEDEFHLVTAFDAIHDQARPDKVLAGIHKVLSRGGTFLMQDIAGSSEQVNNLDHPLGPLMYTISTMHCMTVSLAAGGMGLGTMWGEEKAVEMLGDAGFSDIRVERLEHDFQNVYYVLRKENR